MTSDAEATAPGGDPAGTGAERPAPSLFAPVVGQPDAVARLRAAVARPVHAYLLVGPPGSGRLAAARGFAAALLCHRGGCGTCRDCRLALAGEHPDLWELTHQGASIRREEAEAVRERSLLAPVEGARKVLVLPDFEVTEPAAAALLLKTIEEPAPSSVFVVLASDVPPELVTVASRCVRIGFQPVPAADVERVLVAEGADGQVAAMAASVAGGDLRRARLLVADAGLAARIEAWRRVPQRLDGTGATVAEVVDELRALIDGAAAPLAARQAAEVAALERRVAQLGERGAGRRGLAERHRRELRRLREEEMQGGLALLARRYGHAAATSTSPSAAVGAVAAIQEAAARMPFHPAEALLLEALLLRLPPLPAPAATDAGRGSQPLR
ncbi:MAG: hypothetical protein IPM45_11950 [Acidimicrobiales bacterium]|nr:hypothetical protein [Acidimicrobiales bacterium]